VRRTVKHWLAAAGAGALVVGVGAAALAGQDWGSKQQSDTEAHAMSLFGVNKIVAESSQTSIDAATAKADPTKLITLAQGLTARVVTTASGSNTDMMALWPDSEHPTHIINCNESGTSAPGVQRIDLATGAVTTIVTGTTTCDPIKRTPWGTIIFGEETGNGQLYELINPLDTASVSLNRATGVFSGGTNPQNLVRRTSLGSLAFEGFGLMPNGVMYYGDEQRPADGTPGGAYFKFVPTNPWTGGAPITDLNSSPFASGEVFALRIGRRVDSSTGAVDYGQGNSTGEGSWVPVCNDATSSPVACSTNPSLRTFAATNKITGYYRPEDLEPDPAAVAAGDAKVCGDNTGIEEFQNYGETICITDGTLEAAVSGDGSPQVQYFVVGDPQFAMPDNLAYQPGRGNWIIEEDGDQLQGNNDIFSCLPDGTDTSLLSDGCVRIATLNDLTAETTGGIFNADGSSYFVSIQHNVTGSGLVLEITGWK
jgi:secreted PhoX family phosphatase